MLKRPYVSKFKTNAGKFPSWTPNRWHLGTIKADTVFGYKTVDAAIMNDFAVHKMIGTAGFCISYAPLGFRIESRARVFKTENWAKCVAEELHPISNNWGAYAEGWDFPEITIKMFNYIFDKAEYLGAFRSELISAPERIDRMPTKDF